MNPEKAERGNVVREEHRNNSSGARERGVLTGSRSSLVLLIIGVMCAVTAAPASAQEIDLSVTTDFYLAWNDGGSGGNNDGSFWDPNMIGVPGQQSFGGVAKGNYSPPHYMLVGESLTGIGTPGAAFAHPVGYTQIWNDSGSGANLDGSMWAPIPPPGYVSLGTLPISGGATPQLVWCVCVREDLVVQGTIGEQIYNDSGSGANSDFSAWDIVAPPGAIDVGGFIGVGNYNQPPDSVAWCLRADAVVTAPAPTRAEVDTLIETYGPVLRFHPQEPYLPDDPTGVLDDPSTTLIWSLVQNADSFSSFNELPLGGMPTSSTTILDDVQEALSTPEATDPEFRYYIDFDVDLSGGVPSLPLAYGNLDRAKAYVRVRPIDGVVTELQFWIWYPWNGPGKAQAECGILPSVTFNPTGDAGTHYADWENVRIRVTNQTLASPGTYTMLNAQLSRHSFDVEVDDGSLLYEGTNPVVYVAKDSHAHYPGPGGFDYDRLASLDVGVCTASVDAFDLTGNGGLELETGQRYELVSCEWPSVAVNPPDWFFFGGQWGGFDLNQFCVSAFGANLYCFEEVGNGKPGLQARDGFDASVPLNADLGSLRIGAESRGSSISSPDAPIDALSPVQDTLTITDGPTELNDVVVFVDIVHERVGDLEVSVTSPSGTTVLLHANGGGADDHLSVRYTTSGNPNAAPYNAGASMVAASLNGTSQWMGENANGTWTLDVVDVVSGNDGIVNLWSVTTTDVSSLFDPDVTSYTLELPAGVTSTTITPQAMNHEAAVTLFLNGETYPIETDAPPVGGSNLLGLASPDIALLPGDNFGTVNVSLPNGLSRDYDLTLTVTGALFRRGDASDDGGVAIDDAIFVLGYLFSSGAEPTCFDAADVDDDGAVALNDAIYVLGYLFSSGPAPTAPGPLTCGMDVNADTFVPCEATAPCQ